MKNGDRGSKLKVQSCLKTLKNGDRGDRNKGEGVEKGGNTVNIKEDDDIGTGEYDKGPVT